jgi:hypothetical protein
VIRHLVRLLTRTVDGYSADVLHDFIPSLSPKPISTPISRVRSICCARAESGHAMAEQATTLIKSRRRIAFLKAQDCADYCSQRIRLQQGFATSEMGFGVCLHSSNLEPLMSALGQKRTSQSVRPMSALPPKADIADRAQSIVFGLSAHCALKDGGDAIAFGGVKPRKRLVDHFRASQPSAPGLRQHFQDARRRHGGE